MIALNLNLINQDFYTSLKPELGKLTDIEKSLRKMGLQKLDTQQFMNSKLSYDFIIRIIDILETNPELHLLYEEYFTDIDKFKDFYKKIQLLFEYENNFH